MDKHVDVEVIKPDASALNILSFIQILISVLIGALNYLIIIVCR